MNVYTFNALRLGDNIAHLHFLRRVAPGYSDREFIHYAHGTYLPQLIEFVADTPNIKLLDLDSFANPPRAPGEFWSMAPMIPGAINSWRNAEGRRDAEPEEIRHDYTASMIQHFDRLAQTMGVENPIRLASDLLMDYPLLRRGRADAIDVLVVNSAPQSGQCPRYNGQEMATLVADLVKAGHKVVTTAPVYVDGRQVPCTMSRMMTVAQIGVLAANAQNLVAVATGPMWPCLNVLSAARFRQRIIISEPERVDYMRLSVNVGSVGEAARLLMVGGLLK